MRFDPVSARYAEFGPFFTGLVLAARRRVRAGRALPRQRDDERRRRSGCSCRSPRSSSTADDLRDREAVRRRPEHPAGQRRGALRLGDPRALRRRPARATRRSRTSRASAAPSTAWKATSSPADAAETPTRAAPSIAEDDVLDAVVGLGAAGVAQLRRARALATSKPIIRLKSATATSSGPSASPSRRSASTSSTGRPGIVLGSMHDAVVDDPLEHRQRRGSAREDVGACSNPMATTRPRAWH